MELPSVWHTALISCSLIIFICVCLHGITCTDRSSSGVLQNQRFSSHSTLEWILNILAVPKDNREYYTKALYLHLQLRPQYYSGTTKGYKVQNSWKECFYRLWNFITSATTSGSRVCFPKGFLKGFWKGLCFLSIRILNIIKKEVNQAVNLISPCYVLFLLMFHI